MKKTFYTLIMTAAMTMSVSATEWTDVSTAAEFKQALADLKEGVRLTADISDTSTSLLLIDCGMVIDLNGHRLDLNASLAHRGGDLFEIVDNSAAGTGAVHSTSSVLVCSTPGEVVLRGGSFTGEGYNGVISITKYGVVRLEGAKITAPPRGRAIINQGHLLIAGGTIVGADRDLSPVYTECGEIGYGVTEMTGGAVYAGNITPSTCFENSYWTDGDEVEEGQTILPEGVHDGGAIVLGEEWALPGTYYVNYHIPEGAQVQPNFTHYYTPGEAIALPECDYRDGVPFAGWSASADDTSALMTEIPADADRNYQLYPVWKYVGLPDAVTPDFTPQSVSPEPGTQVEAIETITLAYGEDVMAELREDAEDFGYVMNRTTGEKVSTISITTGGWTGEVYLTATPPVTDNGSYLVFIPAGVFGNDDWYYDDYQDGRCNPDLRYEYTIRNRPQGTTPTEVDPASGSVVESLSVIRITFPGETVVLDNYIDEKIEVRNESGDIVCEMDASCVESDEELDNVMILTLPEPITAVGTYTMTIPEGFFSFDWWERDCSALTYTWEIKQNGVECVVAPGEAEETEYFSPQGIRIRSPRPGEMVIWRRGGETGKLIMR